MCSPSAPPAPDYTAAANATAAGNLEATRAATKANRINQYTPYGTLTYSQKPTGGYDYGGYNTAISDYNKALSDFNARKAAGEETGTFQGVRPTLEGFAKTDPDSGWEQTVTLTPEAQQALDQQLALNRKYGETANVGFDKVRELFENPQLDMSMLPERAINVGQTAQQAIMSRLQPTLDLQEEQLRARLANQGIGLGSTAYGREQNLQGQRRNDLEMQAALQGINLDQANRSAALQEQAYIQDRPLNLINALRTGNQVTNPQFQQFAQQQTTQGPDLLNAANAQYNSNIDAFNAQSAQGSGIGSALGGAAGMYFGGPMGASMGASLGSGLFSDKRLKKNIKLVGKHASGLNIYSYEYIWGGPTHIGVMAQEVEEVNPGAVFEVAGYKAVDYGRL